MYPLPNSHFSIEEEEQRVAAVVVALGQERRNVKIVYIIF
jgi:hypothetical protein